jgi:hypothetical protein
MSMCWKPAMSLASIPGMTVPRSKSPYAEAFSTVVQPRQNLQIVAISESEGQAYPCHEAPQPDAERPKPAFVFAPSSVRYRRLAATIEMSAMGRKRTFGIDVRGGKADFANLRATLLD